MKRHSVTSLETARSLGNGPSWGGGVDWGRSMYSALPSNRSVSYLSLVYGRSLWAGLNGGENSLHWKANMLPLFSIMTLWCWCLFPHLWDLIYGAFVSNSTPFLGYKAHQRTISISGKDIHSRPSLSKAIKPRQTLRCNLGAFVCYNVPTKPYLTLFHSKI